MFESVARHQSFAKAADELYISRGAVGKHIANLEAYLGIQLFLRRDNRIALTKHAKVFLGSVSKALDIFRSSVEQVTSHSYAAPIRLRVLQRFPARWLNRRLLMLKDFSFQITLTTNSVAFVDFAKNDVDVAIEGGPNPSPATESFEFGAMEVLPVCHPALVNGHPPPVHPQDVAQYNLLCPTGHPDLENFWVKWGRSVGLDACFGKTCTYFDSLDAVSDAAMQGLGIGIAARKFVEDDLAAGRLIAPLPCSLEIAMPYYIVTPKEATNPQVNAFVNWLRGEISRP